MTRLEDRQTLLHAIEAARAGGARLAPACALAGIDPRTVQRWQTGDGLARGDRRPDADRPMPSHALTASERARIIAVANQPRFAETPPARIVPALADEGTYIASESSFHRVLRAAGQMNRRGRARPPRPSRPPSTHIAARPGEVWCWDMTFLPAQVQGRWFYLYLILDLFSRKVVGFEVHEADTPTMPPTSPGAPPWPRACTPRRPTRCCTATTAPPSRPPPCSPCSPGSASDPPTPARGSVTTIPSSKPCSAPPSIARPSHPRALPTSMPLGSGPPASCTGTTTSTITAAFATSRRQRAMPDKTGRCLLAATRSIRKRARNPRRWSRQTRNWTPVAAVMLNPERDAVIQAALVQSQSNTRNGEAA